MHNNKKDKIQYTNIFLKKKIDMKNTLKFYQETNKISIKIQLNQ
jgi:hypothetical protein